MKKSLIALAVAGAFAAPAFAATSNVDVYGIVNVAIQDTNASGSDIQVTDNFSRIGFKGAEDLGGGLKAVWQIESGLGSGTDGMGTGSIGTRNTFVGLAGGFGTFVMGRHDTPYKLGTLSQDIFGDTIADYNLGRLDGVELISNTHDHRNPDAIAYISPTWSGFHFAIAAVATNTAANLNNGDSVDAWSATGVYANGPLFASLSYQTVDLLDSDAYKLGLGYTFGDTTVNLVYENIDGATAAADRDSWLVNVKHAMGPITLKAQYGQADVGTANQDQLAIGADYALSKRTTAYFVYGKGDNDAGKDASGWNLGIKHSF
jgi:predicted porin